MPKFTGKGARRRAHEYEVSRRPARPTPRPAPSSSVRSVEGPTHHERKTTRHVSTVSSGGGPARYTSVRGRPTITQPTSLRKATRQTSAAVRRAYTRSQKVLSRGSAVSGFDSEQNKVVHGILRTGSKVGATPKQKLSAVETGIVEADMRNPTGGTGTSAGWRQELNTYGSVAERTNVKHAARRYFQEAKELDSPVKSAGELAADVQRPAPQYRGRYAAVEGQAQQVLKQASRPRKPSRKDQRTLRRAGVPLPTRPPKPANAGKRPYKKAVAKASQLRHPERIVNPKWDPDNDAHSLTLLAKGISAPVHQWSKKYDVVVGEAKADSGHVSPGHLQTGTATDVYPRENTEAGWDKLERGLAVLAADGFEVGYDASRVPGTQSWANHGRNNHAHIEWAGQGSAPNALTKLAGTSKGQIARMERGSGGGGAVVSGTGVGAYGGFSSLGEFSKATGTPMAEAKSMTKAQRAQAARKVLNKLEGIFGKSGEASDTTSKTITRLERKYGKAQV